MLSNLFYRDPRLLVLTVSLILVAGLSSYQIMPRMEDPKLTERAANLNTIFPGADAERVEALVTEKLEEKLLEIEEVKEFRSFSRSGISTIAIELHDDVFEPDPVWSRVRDKIGDARPELPADAMEPVFDQLSLQAYALIVGLSWNQDDEPSFAIIRRLSEQLEDELKAIGGTEKIDMFGDPDEEILVRVQQDQLAARGLTVDDVSRQIGASDAKVPAGQLRNHRGDLLIEVDSELDSIRRVGSIPIAYGDDGQSVQLEHIASITKGIAQPPDSVAILNGRRAVVLGVLVRNDYRVDRWSRQAQKVLNDFDARLTRGVELVQVFSQNQYVETRLISLGLNLLLGSLAVVVVIVLLMGWRSAIIVGSALPLSALMVLTGMNLLDIPIHQMSITGLVLALGLLIDNAIVIVDDVSVKMERGLAPAEAVSSSVGHLALPLLGSTLTTAFAFGPIALMPGPAGEFVGSIAISVILAIASSFLLAMTIVPALTAFGLRSRSRGLAAGSQDSPLPREHGFIRRVLYQGFSNRRLSHIYETTLRMSIGRPIVGVCIGLVLPVLGFIQARHLSEQFFPPADRDQIQIELEMPTNTSLAGTMTAAEQIRKQIQQRSEVDDVHWFLGRSAPTFYYNVIPRRQNTPRYANALVQLKSSENSKGFIRSLQTELDQSFRGARVLVRQLEQGPPFDAPIEIRLFGSDMDQLRELGDQMRTILASTSDVIHVRAELSESMPKLALNLDEEQTRIAGLDHSAIARQMNTTLEGAVAGSILEATEELPVRVRVDAQARGRLSDIGSIDLMAPGIDGDDYRGVPLSAIGTISLTSDVTALPHFNGRRMNEVQAFISAGVLPAVVLAEFETRLAAADFQLPVGYSYEFGGEARQRDNAVGNLMASVGVLLVLMVATLVLSFGSFRMMMLVGAVALLSVGLGLGALWVFGYPFGFMAIVGTMGLIGVAINDSIVVLAALREDPQARTGQRDAVRGVVMRSTRHIVATSLTTMAGFTPLLLGGGDFWPPLATAIAGGVGGATILALYFIPSAYVMVMCRGCPAAELSDVASTIIETEAVQVA